MQKTKLTKSQQSLFRSWTDDYQRILGVIQGLCQDNLNLRLEKIAVELGIDLENGDWNFDQRTLEFSKKGEAAAPANTFPGEPEADNVDVPVGEPEKTDVDGPQKEV